MRMRSLLLGCLVGLLGMTALGQTLGQNGQYVANVVLRRGDVPHTFWVKGFLPTASFQSLSVTAPYNTTNEVGETVSRTLLPYESMETFDSNGRVTGFYVLLTEQDWAQVPEGKDSLVFTCTVRGRYDARDKYNNMFELGHESGRKQYPEKETKGSSVDNPYCIAPQAVRRSVDCDSSDKFFSGTFYLCADLKAGHKYMFGLESATDYPMTMCERGTADNLFTPENTYTNVWTDCCAAYVVVPERSGSYTFRVESGQGSFRFHYEAVPFRTPAQHPHGEISTVKPAIVVPGYLNDPESGAFDNVIDQGLFAFSNFTKGDNLVFSVTNVGNSCTNLLLRLYDSNGQVLGESRRTEGDAFGGRVAWMATRSGSESSPLYVGICQELAEGEVPTAGTVVLSVARVELVERVTLVTAVPDDADRSPVDSPGAVATDERRLGPTEWSNVFALPVRAGITYRVKAKIASGGSDNGYALAATAYTLSGTTKKPLAANLVTDAAKIDPSADGWWEIYPEANATVYIEVSVVGGAWGSGGGLDYGPYVLCATGKGGGELGLLRADMSGAPADDMGWKVVSGPVVAGIVASKEPYYPAGSTVILPVGGAYAVAAKPISGFKGVSSKGYDANVFVTEGAVNTLRTFRYFDTADPLDDDPNTKTKIAAKSGIATDVGHSLWNAYEGETYRDTNDWFTVSASEGAFYRFSLPWVSDECATEVRVFGPNDWTRECEYNVFKDPKRSVRISAEKGTYYVRVANDRPDSSTNCAYTLRTLMTVPGTIRFSKNAITVKDTDAYVDVTVNRTGKDGRIRVKCYTVAGEALPGTDYYPIPKSDPVVLTWENGDNKAKTVRIKLVPDIVTEPIGVAKKFLVQFETYGWDEIDTANEYVPRFDAKMGDAVTVTIAETKKKNAGTVQVVCDNPKKPVFDVVAGGTLEIPFERVLGSNGIVGMVATTVKGTANKSGETDFTFATVTNVWEDGVGGRGAPVLAVRTKRLPSDYTAKKTFTVKLMALTSKKGDEVQYEKPKLAASTITINILNDKFGLSVADWSKSKVFPSGILGIKEGKSGSWFCTDVAATGLFAVPAEKPADISFTLAGPGRFVCDAEDVRYQEGDRRHTVTNWVKTGKQTLKLSNLSRIHSYAYVQLPTAEANESLVDKAVVRAGEVEFRFTGGSNDVAEGIAYRVYALSNGASGAKKGSTCKLGDPETEIGFDGRYATNVWCDAVNKGKWTWRVDSFFVGGSVTNVPKSAWSFTVADESKLPPGAELPVTPIRGVDAYGNDLVVTGGARIVLHRLVKADFAVGAPGSKVAKVSGSLPKGLSLKSVKRSDGLAQYRLVGLPTKAGDDLVVLQETADGVKGVTTALAIAVEDAGRPEGTFNGLAVVSADDAVGQLRQSVAQVSFTAASSGKLSAKALIGGKAYAFADTGYSCARTNDEGRVTLEATLLQPQKVKRNGEQVTFTNEIRLSVFEAPVGDATFWPLTEPKFTLLMRALPDLQGDGYSADIAYSGTLVRDNTKVKEWVEVAAGFSGYYTVALVPDTKGDDNLPGGNGYLTMALDAKGMAKVSGALADGSSYSASLPVAFGGTNGETTVVLPLYAAPNKSVFAGWLGVRFPEGRAPTEPVTGSWRDDVPVVQTFGDGGVVWFNDDSGATYDGKFGFWVDVHPVGGWYDTVVNLQRHYIDGDSDHTFSVDTATVDELWQVSDLIHQNVGSGYDIATFALPCGQSVDLAVNDLVVEKQALEKDSTKSYYVWDDCVNPANVKLTFKRATGILTGTCSVWYEGLNAKGVLEQRNYSNCKHAGVFLMCRGSDALLDDDTVTAGALVVPQKIKLPTGSSRTWNANYRFNVKSARRPLSWDED